MKEEDLKLGLVTKIRGNGTTENKQYSPEALKALDAKPQHTTWGLEDGRPIYQRLPMASEGYQKSYDIDQAMVYLDATIPTSVGPGTLQVLKSQRDWRILDIMDGTISWTYGEFDVERRRINLQDYNNGLGLQDGEYQVGYILTHVDNEPEKSRFPGFVLAETQNTSLANVEVFYDASSETIDHQKSFAIDNYGTSSWWPNSYHGADAYTAGTHYTVDFLEPTSSAQFNLIGDEGKTSSTCALYRSDDAIVWYLNDQTKAVQGTWSLNPSNELRRYTRFHFWDGTSSIAHFRYTGEGYFRDRRVLLGDSRAVFYIKSLYDAVEQNHILLAHFTVKGGAVTNLVDHRRVTYDRYQPVANWLTTFQDEQLRCNFDHVVYYAEQYMSPETANFHLYNEMDDSICTGLGEVTLGSQNDVPVIRYPDIVELLPDTSIDANKIEFVPSPELDGDLATMAYAEHTLTYGWSLDNGSY